MKLRVLIRGLVMLGILAGVGFLLKTTPLGSFFERDAIDDLVRGQDHR
mgnify:FL=1